VDYLFLQVDVVHPRVAAGQPCGNILAAVGPFAVERGLYPAGDGVTTVRIHMVNTGARAEATFPTVAGRPVYEGDALIAGVPFPAAPVRIVFADTAGSVCGSLRPTGRDVDTVEGVDVTCVDDGMPVVLVAAADVGVTGYEDCETLEADAGLRARVERLRLAAGELMGLGDVSARTVPKVTLVAPARDGGSLCTRTFIPHRCHTSIGVLGAVSVAAAIRLPGSVAAHLAAPAGPDGRIRLEHPTGWFDTEPAGERVAVLRTARKLFDGLAWPRPS
jgi:4-oxalomesaconate tautomerase